MIKEKTFTQKVKMLVEKAWLALTTSLKNSIPQILAVVAAFLIGAIVLAATGHGPLEAYGTMLVGAFGDIYGIGQTLTQATPILFTALAFLLSFKCGLFNLGAEGQLLIGGFFAAVVGVSSTVSTVCGNHRRSVMGIDSSCVEGETRSSRSNNNYDVKLCRFVRYQLLCELPS
jgi:hypothetical protein